MKLHLPLFLRKSVLSCLALVAGCTLSSGTLAFADDLVLGAEDTLSIDYAEADSIPDLENGTLQLDGDTLVQLLNCGSGDGKTYTLATGVSCLVDAEGNPISLDSSNNAISNYFDADRPGTGFWADGSLVLTDDGTLQLVRHDQAVKDAVVISTRQTGGAKYQYYAGVSFEDNQYNPTGGPALGGAVRESSVTLSDNGFVLFSGNKAEDDGGQFWQEGEACDSDVVCNLGTGWVSAYTIGGAICANNLTLNGNGSVEFIGNKATSDYVAHGGAVYGETVTLSDNGSVKFIGNLVTSSLDALGGAIDGATITLNGNGSVEFIDNKAFVTSYGQSQGGAIYGERGITLNDNGSILFQDNNALYGGAICVEGGVINLNNNVNVSVIGNSGSAIYSRSGAINLNNNGSVSFSVNTGASGGAIYGMDDIILNNNGSVSFSGNSGSAIYSYYGAINLNNNGSVSFSGNTGVSGGAIYGEYDVTLNGNGCVSFIGNSVRGQEYTSDWEQSQGYYGVYGYGGAIYGGSVSLCDNGRVEFIGNNVSVSSSYPIYVYGGAICTFNDVNIRNNDSVEFYQNAEGRNGEYRLNSIVVGGYWSTVSLSAAEGKHITFRDSIYIDAGNTFNLNADYTNANGETIKQQGDIIFTGATTVDDLYAVKGNIAGTEEEILASRTSEVYSMTNLYGGRLRVEDGAIYQGYGITAHAGSASTVRVKDAELRHEGYSLTFNAGTTLELEGGNSISGNVQMLEGSTLAFSALGSHGVTSISGNLTFGDTLTIAGLDTWQGENQILLYTQGNVTGWDADNITIQGTSVNNLTWVNDFLVLNYNSDTFNPAPFKGDIIYTKRLTGNVDVSYYINVAFEGNTVSSEYNVYGGAINGPDVILHNNGNVTFCENTASTYYGADGDDDAPYARGGAIYGDSIALRGNGSVVFSENTAASETYLTDDTFAGGGAIYGDNILLSENNEVSFVGNAAYVQYVQPLPSPILLDLVGIESYEHMPIGCQTSRGGAIYGDNITLSENGEVSFVRNVAGWSLYSLILIDNIFGEAYNSLRETSYGGAIYGDTIKLMNNESVSFIGNAAAHGGAIYGAAEGAIILSGNGSVEFSGNVANGYSYSVCGGAIYAEGDLSIRNNGSVLFEKNVEVFDHSYRLRSICAGGSGNVISLSAAEGKSIEFRDSVYIGSGATVNLNEDYTDAAGVVHKQAGDIIFTGAYAETHLNEIVWQPTAEEIRLSQTTEVYAMTNLYGGRLRVEDGAIYRGWGITAMAGSESTVRVKDATLEHAGYDLIFNAGTTFELEGANSISGNVQMMDGSTLRVVFDDTTATESALTLNDSLTLKKGSQVQNVGSDGKITLQGGGSVCMDGHVDFSVFALGKEWTGTVKLAHITADTNLIMNTIGQAGSTIELEDVMGYTGVNGKTVAANLLLTRSYDANGTEQAAFRVSNGYSNAASDYVMTTFSGTVSGDGKMVFDKTLSGVYTGFKFTGDVADWTGAFEMNAGRTFNLVFGGSATEINADIRDVSKSSTLNLILQADSAMSVNGDVVTDSISVTNGSDVSFYGTVNTGSLTAENSNVTIASNVSVSEDMTVAGLQVQSGGSLTVDGELTASGAEVSLLGDVIAGTLTAENSNVTIASNAGVREDMTVAGLQVQSGGSLTVDGELTASGAAVSLLGDVIAGTLTAENSNVTIASNVSVSEDMTVAGLHLQSGSILMVGGTLCAGAITLDTISANSPWLEVGQFGAGDTIFHLDIDDLNALNLGHGEIVTIARAENAIGSDFNAWLGEGTTSLDAAVYRYDISVSGTDVQVGLDYSNWGTRVWYGNAWVGQEDWEEFLVAGYDAVDGVETVDMGGETQGGVLLLIAPGESRSTTVLSHGEMVVEMAEVVDGRLQIAADATLDTTEMAAEGKEIHLLGELKLSEGRIGTLSGTTGKLSIASGGEVSIDSSVTLGTLTNSGTLDIGKNKLNVATAVTTGGDVIAGEVVVHNRANKAAVFNALVADKVTVTNSLSSNSYKDAISLGDGSAIGELMAEILEVREGTVTLGRTSGSSEMSLLSLDLQNDATLVLNQQATLEVTDTLTATENATVQLKQNATVSYDGVNISNRKESGTLSVNAYALSGEAELELNGAHVAGGNGTIDYKLVNSTVENTGGGTLQVTHAGNSLSGVVASSGNVEVYNVTDTMSLDELRIATGLSVSLLTGGSGTAITPANEANVTVVGLAVFEKGATLNANLTMAAGSELRMEGPLHMGSTLELVSGADTITLSGSMYDALAGMQLGESMTLFTGVDALVLSFDGVSVTYQPGDIQVADRVLASTYFGNLPETGANQQYFITFTTAEVGGGELAFFMAPEPTTTTLSLLALTALAARRRRK